MNMKEFKNKLSLHGSDLSRWEGVKPESVEAFIAESKPAQSLYERAERLDKALDTFEAAKVDPRVIDKAINRMVSADTASRNPRKVGRSSGFDGIFGTPAMMAMAAAVVVVVGIIFFTSSQNPVEVPGKIAVAVVVQEDSVDALMAQAEEIIIEDIYDEEILESWEIAENSVPQAGTNAELDAMIDELISEDILYFDDDIWVMLVEQSSEDL